MNAHFFIGWANHLPAGLRAPLLGFALLLLAGAAALGTLLSALADDPGGGEFLFADGPRTLEGAVTARPYPVLHLADGRFVLLSGVGKTGVEADPALEGRLVAATGVMLKRGEVDQMQVEPPGLAAQAGMAPAPATEDLGRWRIAGEICDGKCWNGAMRPGGGVSHRACANFCLIGGVPPLLVAQRPLAGQSILLLGGPDGGPMSPALLDWVGLRVTLEGAVQRRGGLLVFLADPASVRAAAAP